MDAEFPIISDDPSLKPFQECFKDIHQQYGAILETYQNNEGGLLSFSQGHLRFGIHQKDQEVVYREWAPMAQ